MSNIIKIGYIHPVDYNSLKSPNCSQFYCMEITKRRKEIPEFCVALGKHIRALRKEKELSIEEIAYKAGIDGQNLRKYELGKQEMKVSMLKRIASAFDMTTAELLSFDDTTEA